MLTNEYKIFHAKRIFDILMDAQTPRNYHGAKNISTHGNFRCVGRLEKVDNILKSLFECSLITIVELEKMKKVLNRDID